MPFSNTNFLIHAFLLVALLTVISCGVAKEKKYGTIQPVDKNAWLQDESYEPLLGWLTASLEVTNTGTGTAEEVICTVDYKGAGGDVRDSAVYPYPNLVPAQQYRQTSIFFKYGTAYEEGGSFALHCQWKDETGRRGY